MIKHNTKLVFTSSISVTFIAMLVLSGTIPQVLGHPATTPSGTLTNPFETTLDYSFSGAGGANPGPEFSQHTVEVAYCTGSGCDPFVGGTPLGSGTYSYGVGQNTITPTGGGQIQNLTCETDVTLGVRERHGGGAYATFTVTNTTSACDGGGGDGGDGDPVQTFNPGTIKSTSTSKSTQVNKIATANTEVTNYGTTAPNYTDVSVSIECGGSPVIFPALSVHIDGTTLVTKLNRQAIVTAFGPIPSSGLNCTADTTVGGSGPSIPTPDPAAAPFRIIL